MGNWDIDPGAARKVEERLYKQVDPEREDTERLLELYFDPKGRHSGAWFERIPNEHGANAIGCHDFLAVTMLDLHIPGLLVRDLLFRGRGSEAERLLQEAHLPSDVDLWDADDDVLDAANALWEFLRAKAKELVVPFGRARVSKLLSRKRPRLVPITDGVVRRHIDVPGKRYWAAYRGALKSRDGRLVNRLEQLQEDVPGAGVAAPLRILDAITWIRESTSKAAERSRAEAVRLVADKGPPVRPL